MTSSLQELFLLQEELIQKIESSKKYLEVSIEQMQEEFRTHLSEYNKYKRDCINFLKSIRDTPPCHFGHAGKLQLFLNLKDYQGEMLEQTFTCGANLPCLNDKKRFEVPKDIQAKLFMSGLYIEIRLEICTFYCDRYDTYQVIQEETIKGY